ncbi:MAG: sigma-70 family RNA polymerase sigma factor [Armatimonadetes bacterium]|nr:sigma-70 family RNA polymerase sigma factor [Armatimonadota bacterium]
MADDHALIEQFQRGDRRAFDELVRRHYSLAYNLAYRILGDSDAAADATQAAFVRAYRGLAGYRGGAAFTTWLHRIVVNVSLDMARRQQRATSIEAESDQPTPLEARLPSESLGPDEEVLQRERARAVQRALMKLAPLHRAVLTMYELQGLSYDEIAAVLGVPLGTVKSRLNRARAAFAKALGEYRELFGMDAGQSAEESKE